MKGDLIAQVKINYHHIQNILMSNYYICFYRFDKEKGSLKSLFFINVKDTSDNFFYGSFSIATEFSPDGNKFYITTTNGPYRIYQYDLTKLDKESVESSQILVASLENEYGGHLPQIHGGHLPQIRLAPNGKIYLTRYYNQYFNDTDVESPLYVINKPNLTGDSCDFQTQGTNFTDKAWPRNLPERVRGIFDFDVKIDIVSACIDDTLILTAQSTPDLTGNSYQWTLPDGSQLTGKTIKFDNASYSNEGTYIVRVDINSTIRYDTITVILNEKPKAKISGRLSLCKNSTTTLYSEEEMGGYTYYWSTGQTSPSITVNQAGTYILTVTNGNSCSASDTVEVIYNSDLLFNIVGSDRICLGDTLTLGADINDSDLIYEWSTGQTTPTINIVSGGTYILNLRNSFGCIGSDTLTVSQYNSPTVEFSSSYYKLCQGDSLTIQPINIDENNDYIWSDGVIGYTRTITENAQLYLISTNSDFCSDTAYLSVEFIAQPISKIIADNLEVCSGNTITLTADNYNTSFTYLWNTGQTTPSIEVKKSGVYTLIVSNDGQCSDTSSIEVIIHPPLTLELLADNQSLCFGDSTAIYTKDNYKHYYWSTGDTSKSITVKIGGLYQLIVENEFGCRDTAQIKISSYSPELTYSQEELDFGELCIGESVTKTLQLTMKGSSSFTISSLTIDDPNYKLQSYKSIISEGETIEITVSFSPQLSSITPSELVLISTTPCYYEKRIPLKGAAHQTIKFELPKISSNSGDRIKIPISASLICLQPNQLTEEYELTVSIDKDYIKIDSISTGTIISNDIVGDNRVIKIRAIGSFYHNTTVINTLYGQSLIGGADIVPISLTEVNISKPNYQYIIEDGNLSVTGCVNTLSEILIFSPTKLTISPNPSFQDIDISISSQEEGHFQLLIIDILGNVIYKQTYDKSNRNYEQQSYHLSSEQLINGTYNVLLISPWYRLSEQLLIMR